MDGWIVIHRKIFEWEWYDDVNTFRLFLHLLLKANHESNKWRGMNIERGQHISSYAILAKELKLTTQNVRTSINKLKSTGELTHKGFSKFGLFTINNYHAYQSVRTHSNSQPTVNQQSANNKQRTKQLNNDNNIYNTDCEPAQEPLGKAASKNIIVDEIYFVPFKELCTRRGLEIKINQIKYLELREEYAIKLIFWEEIKKCLAWCYDHNKKIITASRLRNWMDNSIKFQKDRQIKTMQSLKENKLEKKILVPTKMPALWTPPL